MGQIDLTPRNGLSDKRDSLSGEMLVLFTEMCKKQTSATAGCNLEVPPGWILRHCQVGASVRGQTRRVWRGKAATWAGGRGGGWGGFDNPWNLRTSKVGGHESPPI